MNLRGDATYICDVCNFKTKYYFDGEEDLAEKSKKIEGEHMKKEHPNHDEAERT